IRIRRNYHSWISDYIRQCLVAQFSQNEIPVDNWFINRPLRWFYEYLCGFSFWYGFTIVTHFWLGLERIISFLVVSLDRSCNMLDSATYEKCSFITSNNCNTKFSTKYMEVSISMEYHGVYGHPILSVLYIYYMVTRYSKQLWLLIRYSGLVAIAYAICLYSVYIYRSDYCRKDDRPKIIKCLNRNISYLSYRRTDQRTFCTYYDSGHMYR